MKNLILADLIKLKRSLGYKLLLLVLLSFSLIAFRQVVAYKSTAITGLYYLQSFILDFQYISVIVAIYSGIFIASEFSNRTYSIAVAAGNKL